MRSMPLLRRRLRWGVTNPASCGIGGGGFMLIYIAKEGKFYALDYREAAPHARAPTCSTAMEILTRNSRRSDARSRRAG